jgi:uncharacterized protein YbbC (DUF1343 family)
MIRLIFGVAVILMSFQTIGQTPVDEKHMPLCGADQPDAYIPHLEGQKVALLVNQTSLVGNNHLIDFLLANKINIKLIFAAEHGIRGLAEAGETVNHGIDAKSSLPIVSLYGKEKKPSARHLQDIDLVLFDVQDVGCRFFTYISTLHYLMEACAESGKEIMIFDRPNPNGDYVDGPVLDTTLTSFVGMHPIPVVHGCTVGELAMMINGEGWLAHGAKADLTVIPVLNYTHSTRYSLPVKPSPNLPNDLAVRLYPSLCLFEATNVSIGRGTTFPFQVIGYPREGLGRFVFTPVSIEGMSKSPLQENKTCYGDDLRTLSDVPSFTLSFFLDYYKKIGNPEDFWSSKRWIGLLTGDLQFYTQVNEGWSEPQIRATWNEKLEHYRLIRKKYLLYPDFE